MMNLTFVQYNTLEYQKAVKLRILCFFSEYDHALELINDPHEQGALHLIYRKNDQILGTGRLHFKGNQATISQMAVHPDHQKKGIGEKILIKLIHRSTHDGYQHIHLSARITALRFYEKFGFQAYGKEYASSKTGVVHQNMEMPVIQQVSKDTF